MSWQQYVEATKNLGFQRVAIIARANYQTLGTTNTQTDIATAWKDGDVQINENQELLDDWKDQKKKCFCFFGKKYNIVTRFEESGYYALVCASGNDICIVAEFKTIWFVAFGIKKKLLDKDAKGGAGGFSGAQQAYGKITKDVWDALADAEI